MNLAPGTTITTPNGNVGTILKEMPAAPRFAEGFDTDGASIVVIPVLLNTGEVSYFNQEAVIAANSTVPSTAPRTLGARLNRALNPRTSDPVTWTHFSIGLGASVVIFAIGFAMGLGADKVGVAWAGVIAAAAGAVALPQFLVAHWVEASEQAASREGVIRLASVSERNSRIHRTSAWFWYIALVALVVFTGVVAGSGVGG